MRTFLSDLRYGYRRLLATPGFTSVAVLSLALGIGANTAIFSFIDSVLLRSLPVAEPKRLVIFGDGKGRGIYGGAPDGPMTLFSWEQYKNFRSRNSVFEDVAAVNSREASLYAGISGAPEPLTANLVSGNYFALLGLKPVAGRFFDESADRSLGVTPDLVLNEGYWARRFHRSPAVIGQSVRIGGRSWNIVGVAPRGFFGTRLGESPDIWIPASMEQQMPGAIGTPELSDLMHDPFMQYL